MFYEARDCDHEMTSSCSVSWQKITFHGGNSSGTSCDTKMTSDYLCDTDCPSLSSHRWKHFKWSVCSCIVFVSTCDHWK